MAGEIAQCDLWFPPVEIAGRVRPGAPAGAAAGADDGDRVLAVAVGGADPVPRRRRTCSPGWWQLIAALGAVPRVLVWDGEGAIGRWRGGRTGLTGQCQAFRGTLGAKVVVCKPRDPEAKGLVERAHDYLETSFLPGRRFAGPADFNAQLAAWLAVVNTRQPPGAGLRAGRPDRRPTGPRCWRCRRSRRRPGGGPRRGWPATTTSGWTPTTTPSTRPSIGRRVEVIADLDRVRVLRARAGWSPTTSGPGPGTRRSPTRRIARPRGALRRQRAGGRCARCPSRRSSSAAWLTTTPSLGTGRTAGQRDGRRRKAHGPGPGRRDRVPDPGAEGPRAARRR